MSTSLPEPGRPEPGQVVELLREQAPELARLPVTAPQASGSSNWVFRLGDDLAVRMPRSDDYSADLRKEARWLPVLHDAVTTPLPAVVFHGAPSAAFERPWLVVTWLPGTPPGDLDDAAQHQLATGLGKFLRELHAVDTQGLPSGPPQWNYRTGEPVTDESDAWVEHAADELRDLFRPERVRLAWRLLRQVPTTDVAPCWVHTDLAAENLLVADDGRLSGVVDFGGVGIGDPAADLIYAWSLFGAEARATLRQASGCSDATWQRARALAFAGPGLVTLAAYRHSLPQRAARLTAMLEAIAAEVGVALR